MTDPFTPVYCSCLVQTNTSWKTQPSVSSPEDRLSSSAQRAPLGTGVHTTKVVTHRNPSEQPQGYCPTDWSIFCHWQEWLSPLKGWMQESHTTTSLPTLQFTTQNQKSHPRNKLYFCAVTVSHPMLLLLNMPCFVLEAWYIKISKPVQFIHPPFIHYWEYHSNPQDD